MTSHDAPSERGGPVGTPAAGGMQVVIVSGLSGAGRSTAAKCLEDLGFFVVDNLPPELISTMVDLGSRSRGAVTRIAVVVDVRSRAFTADLREAITALDQREDRPRLLFLDASDAELVRRYEHVRRAHPLQGDGTLIDGIKAERELLRGLAGNADLVIDTTMLNVHELRAKIDAAFGSPTPTPVRATVLSFGYKYGLPLDADVVMDVRFLPNPHWIVELRPFTGLDRAVRDYVLEQDGAADFVDRFHGLLQLVGAGYRREGRRYLTVAIGCTGGKHRSVVIAERIGALLTDDGVEAKVVHRDLGRE